MAALACAILSAQLHMALLSHVCKCYLESRKDDMAHCQNRHKDKDTATMCSQRLKEIGL
jgi:hypothetical protein